jgi:hypothetical protein
MGNGEDRVGVSQADQPDICEATTGDLATADKDTRKRRRDEYPKMGPTQHVPQRCRTAVEQQARAVRDEWVAVTVVSRVGTRGTVDGCLGDGWKYTMLGRSSLWEYVSRPMMPHAHTSPHQR